MMHDILLNLAMYHGWELVVTVGGLLVLLLIPFVILYVIALDMIYVITS